MRKISLAIILSIAVLLLVSSVALAGSGVHSVYEEDGDGCTGCHRDHSITSLSTSSLAGEEATLSGTTQTTGSCLTCHGTAATGAYTNVEDGIFDITGRTGEGTGTPDAALLGGGFERVGAGDNSFTSRHEIDGIAYTVWDGGLLGDLDAPQITMECATCHDTHGTSNYRMLRDNVNGQDVTAFVESNETGFPGGGFVPHTSYGTYVPNFTDANYKSPTTSGQGMNGWCIACHSRLSDTQGPYDVEGDEGGPAMRFRHPVESISIQDYDYGGKSLNPTLTRPYLDQPGDQLQCLTCHRAHGTDASMTGRCIIAPTFNSSLLREVNRTVCQDCHQK